LALYDNWTWDSANRLMTIIADDVKGYDEAHAFSFSDIPDCIVLKGWDASYNESTSGKQLEFQFRIVIGNGTTTTWFADDNKQICFRNGSVIISGGYAIEVKAYGNFRAGTLIDATLKLSKDGISFLDDDPIASYLIRATVANSKVWLYSSSFIKLRPYVKYLSLGNSAFSAPIWNCYIEKIELTACYLDAYNLDFSKSPIENRSTTPSEFIRVWANTDYAFNLYLTNILRIKNVIARNNVYLVRAYSSVSTNGYLVNVDSDAWAFWYYSTYGGKIFRQYEFDVHCQDKDGNPLSGVDAIAEYISPYGTAFTDTTNASGDLTGGTKTVDRGWFERVTGDTENMKTPLKVTYRKAGYQAVVKYYPMTEKTKDRVVLQKAVDTIFVDGKPALNLSESDPENQLYAVI